MANRRLLLLSAVVLAFAFGIQSETVPCNLREVQYGKVCVCTADHCDYLENPTLSDKNEFALISTSKQGLRFDTLSGKFGSAEKYTVADYQETIQELSNTSTFDYITPLATAFLGLTPASQEGSRATSITRSVTLSVDRSLHKQNITGFGGSYTGAVTHLMEQYPQALQDHLYKSFYADEGIGFNLMRVSIGGCDFDLEAWAYNDEVENDLELSGMKELDERDIKRVAHIKRLMEVSGLKTLRIKGAAWGSPRWMKTNKRWTGFGRLKKEYYQLWADYHLKWLELMEANGLPIWAISTGNEPLNGIFFMYFVRFLSLGWTPQRQAIWLDENLGPTLRNSKFKDTLIFGNDDQLFGFPHWFKMMNHTRPNSIDYLDGLAMHWYWDEIFGPSLVDQTLEYMPDKILLISESCIGDKPWQKAAPLLGSWERCEKYARAFLHHLQHSYNGWIDWNLILDEQGGPNYVHNYVDAPVVANTTTFAEFYKQPMFYAMGHFSKFVPEGSIRIQALASNINLNSVAFLRPDGQIAAILFNSGRADLDITVADSVRGSVTVNVPAKSIHTILYQ